MRCRSLIICVLGWLVLSTQASADPRSGATAQAQRGDVGVLKIVVSMHPLQLLVDDLVADLLPVEVINILPANATPHDFTLSPQRMQAIRNADWVIWLGAAAEPYLVAALKPVPRAGTGHLALLDLPGVKTRFFSDDHDHSAHHDHAGHDHTAGALDPHLWWHADNLVLLAEALVRRLVQTHPEQAPVLVARLDEWRTTLLASRLDYREQYRGRSLLALSYHDAFGYMIDDLGLQASDVLMRSPDIKPGARQVLQVRQRLARDNVLCLLMEPAAQPKWLNLIDPDARLHRVVIDPLGWDVGTNQQRIQALLVGTYQKLAPCLSEVSGAPTHN